MIYPWHHPTLQTVVSLHREGNLPHAIMIAGGAGLGVGELASLLAKRLLCEAPIEDQPCNHCKACSLFEAGSHNDFLRLSPEEEGKQIKVDAVRSMVEFITGSSMRDGYKVAIIEPVEGLNINGANALLKTLEEPQGNAVIFLVCDRPEGILATIRSRCQVLNITAPERVQALEWLAVEHASESADTVTAHLDLAHGLPLLADRYLREGVWQSQLDMLEGLSKVLKQQSSVPQLAAYWIDDALKDRIEWLLQWIEQMIRYASTQDEGVFKHAEGLAMLRYLADRASLEQLFQLREKHLAEYALLGGTTNPNTTLLCESLILEWLNLMPATAN